MIIGSYNCNKDYTIICYTSLEHIVYLFVEFEYFIHMYTGILGLYNLYTVTDSILP